MKLLLTQKKIARELVKSGLFNSEQQIVDIAIYEWMNKQGLFKAFKEAEENKLKKKGLGE